MKRAIWKLIFTLVILTAGCEPKGDEPKEVVVAVNGAPLNPEVCVNAEGWSVSLTAFKIAVQNIEFTIEGETHAGLNLWDLLIPNAYAHPGHLAGGDVTGELPGQHIVDFFSDNAPIGEARLLFGEYHGMNFVFRTGDNQDGLPLDDALLGHGAFLKGNAEKEGQVIAFEAVVDFEAGAQMVGAPFEAVVDDNPMTLRFHAHLVDPTEGDTLFDGLDFGALEPNEDSAVRIVPGSAAHNMLMKTLIRHDHYSVSQKTQ